MSLCADNQDPARGALCRRVRQTCCVLAVLLGLPVCLAGGPAGLGQYVPSDVWFYAEGTHVPQRDFLAKHWEDVFKSLKVVRPDLELKRVVASNLSPDQQESFEQSWAGAMELLGGVEWADLIEHEVAFAERFGSLVPDILVLCRPSPPTREQNVRGLAQILRALASMDESLEYSETTRNGIGVWSVEARNAPVALHMVHGKDVVGLMIGTQAMNDVVALLSGEPCHVTSIAQCGRYREALGHVPAPGHAVLYLDMDRLFNALPRFPQMVFGAEECKEEVSQLKKLIVTVIGHFDFMDYVVTVNRMDGLREYTYTYSKIKADAASKPICRMLTERQPIKDFHRYIPKEATSYGVSTFVDLNLLYDTVLDMIRTEFPEGAGLVEQWNDFQKRNNFDLRHDFLDWFSGESISITLPPRTQGPHAGEDWVILFRVSDADKARIKLQAALERLPGLMERIGQPFGRIPAKRVPVEGFQCLMHPMFAMTQSQPCLGVWRQWLVFGGSEDAVIKVLETHAGKRPSILANPRFQAEGLIPDGPVTSASFADLSKMGEQLAAASFMTGFMAGMVIPNEPETQPIKAMLNAISKLGPVLAELNFFKSYSEVGVYQDGAWRSTAVTTYKPCEPAKSVAPRSN